MLRVDGVDRLALDALLQTLALTRIEVAPDAPIPHSYWGEPEAGIRGRTLYARADTPLHSLLHEAAHVLVAAAVGRHGLDTDASDSTLEEDAACYLQILLAARLPAVGSARLMADMDAWGYSFRLGSTRAWFERDAEDARRWLIDHGLVGA